VSCGGSRDESLVYQRFGLEGNGSKLAHRSVVEGEWEFRAKYCSFQTVLVSLLPFAVGRRRSGPGNLRGRVTRFLPSDGPVGHAMESRRFAKRGTLDSSVVSTAS
jgi:hypothetical protein